METKFEKCFNSQSLILTEGAVGQRIEREFMLKPDADVMYAGLIYDTAGRKALTSIYSSYLLLAQQNNLPILLFTNTRRANKDRVLRSKYKNKNLMADYAYFLRELAAQYSCEAYIGGMMGCRGDAYSGNEGMETSEAEEFHLWQMRKFEQASIDFLIAGIMPALAESTGMARVMEKSTLPYIISLMINPGGTLLDGTFIHNAIQHIDGSTNKNPLCYITNCVHPSVLKKALMQKENSTELVRSRFCGIQANAASLAPHELDGSQILKTTLPKELAKEFYMLHDLFPMKIYGGCCGTDESHISELIKILKMQ